MSRVFLLIALLWGTSLYADPPSDNIWPLVDQAQATLEQRERDLRNRIGSVSFGPDYDGTNGRIAVTSERGGPATPRAEVIGVFDLSERTFYWGWSAPDTRGFSTQVADALRDRARDAGLADVGLATLDVSRPADAFGLSMLAVMVSEGQMMQFFQHGSVFYYVLLDFDGGTP